MDYKKYISQIINLQGVSQEEILEYIIIPPENDKGDYSLPCFKFSKTLKKSPVIIANELAQSIKPCQVIQRAEAVNGYLNIFINKDFFIKDTIEEILSANNYGASREGEGKTVCIDYSSVNIAKPFHIGHLSTTVIGGALYRIYNYLGYKAIGINHLGDWGTQFGKLISAYKRWSSLEDINSGGINEMLRIYVKFHQEAESNPSLDEEARGYFKKIEDNDAEATEIFTLFKDITLKEVKRIYNRLDIEFDYYSGESFYNDKMDAVLNELESKNLLSQSEGAKIVDLDKYGMPPCLILKADGATLYATRDIAAAFYRKKTFDFYKCLYVVAYQQNLHFNQFFKVIELMGYPWASDLEHVAFGMVSLEEGGAMSTRKGNLVLLEDVLNRCVEKSYQIISQKNPNLENKKEIAEVVGTGAVVFSALINNRIKDIVFSYDKVLNFDGETGPYIQYTCVRANSVLEKAQNLDDIKEISYSNLNDIEYELIKLSERYKQILKDVITKNEPSYLTRHLIEIAKCFNKFYFECKILSEEEGIKNRRLLITKAVLKVVRSGLSLLGIKVPDKM